MVYGKGKGFFRLKSQINWFWVNQKEDDCGWAWLNHSLKKTKALLEERDTLAGLEEKHCVMGEPMRGSHNKKQYGL